MVDVEGSVDEIFAVASEIKVAAAGAKQNRENCLQIEKRVVRVLAMLAWLDKSETAKKSVIISDLDDLHGTLRLALKLVTGCRQEKKVTCLLRFAAGDLSKQLRQVNRNITESIVRLANNVHNNIVFNTQRFQDGFRPALPENTAEESSPSSQLINDTRTGLRQFTLSYLKDITADFSQLISSGSQGDTYLGIERDHKVVVRKFACGIGVTHQVPNYYVRAYSVLGHHKNVVRRLGFCHELVRAIEIHDLAVEEYLPNGSLDTFIEMGAGNQDWNLRLQLIREIAEGVAYLQTKNIIHLDLNPGNILLDADMTPKISGFGISKLLDVDDNVTRTDEFVGTQHYMAPEYVRSGIVSVKNDVYSFGVLLLDIISGSRSRGREYQIDWALGAEAEHMKKVLDPSLFRESKLKEIKRFINIGRICIEMKPEDRPSMGDVLKMLHGRKIIPAPKRHKGARSEPVDPFKYKEYTFFELEAATNNFSKVNLIAEGHIATVYKGELPNKDVVAIKRFRGSWGPQSIARYKDIFSATFQHENIVGFLGYCEEEGREMVVEDYLPSRSLSRIIDGPQHLDMDWPSRFRIILGVANAVDYLHSKGIIHFDLTPANIVIFDTHMNPKICDFGLSKILGTGGPERVTEEFEVTAGSTAPEYADGIISVKNDVYSFGDLVCTLSGMSRSGPPQDLNDLAMLVRVARRMKELFDPSLCKETQLKEIKMCMDIGLLCTQLERKQRPTIEGVLEMLNKKDDKVPLEKKKDDKVSLKKKKDDKVPLEKKDDNVSLKKKDDKVSLRKKDDKVSSKKKTK